MSYTLTELIQDVITDLGLATIGSVSTGDTTHFTDPALKAKGSKYDNWWVIFPQTTDSAAPQGEFAKISSFNDTSGQFTLSVALSNGGPAADDLYMLISSMIPLDEMIKLVNLALRRLGEIPVENTSLTANDVLTEFAVAFLNKRPNQVYVQETGDTEWVPNDLWTFEAGALIFSEAPAAGTIKIVYEDYHPTLKIFNETISKYIPKTLAIAAVKVEIGKWLTGKGQGGDPFLLQQLNDAAVELNTIKMTKPIWKVPLQTKQARY